MLHKVIENKAQAKRVASQLAADLRRELEIYKSYKVAIEQVTDGGFYVQVYSDATKSYCTIMTDSCHESVNKVVSAYKMMYQYITHCIDVKKVLVKKEYKVVPVLEVYVSYQK